MIIIGITGTIGAGKGTIVDYLVEKRGFRHFSVRAYLLELIREKGMPENRDSMFNLANELRSQHGPSYVTDQLYYRAIESGQNCIIESIRTPGEIDSLRKTGDFILIAVDAKPEVRYERIFLRQSETDHISLPDFIENETREMTTDDPNKQNLKKCIEAADVVLDNNGSMEELVQRAEKALEKYSL